MALLGKVDVESAYRIVPVHQSDRPLQAVEWQGLIYVDPMLPFGLLSTPKIFNALVNALEWCLRNAGVWHVFHYLDDFIVIGARTLPNVRKTLKTLNKTFAGLGVPIADHKGDGPMTCLTFLGIEVDTVASQLHLPRKKLD